jgi:hypothetical protein
MRMLTHKLHVDRTKIGLPFFDKLPDLNWAIITNMIKTITQLEAMNIAEPIEI